MRGQGDQREDGVRGGIGEGGGGGGGGLAQLCYAMLCYAMIRYAMLRYFMLCFTGSNHARTARFEQEVRTRFEFSI